MRLVFDIDGTICTQEEDYSRASPYLYRIYKINSLYDIGHEIVFIAYREGNNWKEITEEQLRRWGVKYHELINSL